MSIFFSYPSSPCPFLHSEILLLLFFFLLKQLQIGQMLLASKERFESVTSGRTKGKEKRKVVARHHHS